MAEKRMFSKTIINSGKFLKMPSSSRALYFHLGLEADDDGIVEAWSVIQMTNAAIDDFNILVTKGFIKLLSQDDLISYLPHWRIHNTLRADRKKDSIYKDMLLAAFPETNLLESKDRSDVKGKSGRSMDGPSAENLDGPWTDIGRSMDGIGERESRLGENKLRESEELPLTLSVYKGVLNNINISETEYFSLKEKFENVNQLIDHVSTILPNAKPKDDHYAFIIRIAMQDKWPRRTKRYTDENHKPVVIEVGNDVVSESENAADDEPIKGMPDDIRKALEKKYGFKSK